MRDSGQGGEFRCFQHVRTFEPDAIRRPRFCPQYYAWNLGHTPKEHMALERHEQQLNDLQGYRRWVRASVAIATASFIAVVVIGTLTLMQGG